MASSKLGLVLVFVSIILPSASASVWTKGRRFHSEDEYHESHGSFNVKPAARFDSRFDAHPMSGLTSRGKVNTDAVSEWTQPHHYNNNKNKNNNGNYYVNNHRTEEDNEEKVAGYRQLSGLRGERFNQGNRHVRRFVDGGDDNGYDNVGHSNNLAKDEAMVSVSSKESKHFGMFSWGGKNDDKDDDKDGGKDSGKSVDDKYDDNKDDDKVIIDDKVADEPKTRAELEKALKMEAEEDKINAEREVKAAENDDGKEVETVPDTGKLDTIDKDDRKDDTVGNDVKFGGSRTDQISVRRRVSDGALRTKCDPRFDLPICQTRFASMKASKFVFRADGNPAREPGTQGSCCTSKPADPICGHCCGFQCKSGFVPKSPVPALLGVKPSNELCCDEAVPQPIPADVVIAVDYSWSVQRYPEHLAEELKFVDTITKSLLDKSRKGRYRVGVLGFSGSVSWKHKLTDEVSKFSMNPSADQLIAKKGQGAKKAFIDVSKVALNGAGVGYPTFTDKAILAAKEELQASSRPEAKKILLLVTDGAPWPQVEHRSGRYKGHGNRVVKTLQAVDSFKSDDNKFDIVYVSVNSEDYKQYPSFTGTSVATGARTFSWKFDGGDANRILAMCIFSKIHDKNYCSKAITEYGAVYCDSDDGDARMASEIVKWEKDPFPSAFPESASDSRVTTTFTNYGKQKMRYVSALPKNGMSRFQYTDLSWRRQQVLWQKLTSSEVDYAEFLAHTVSVERFEALARRMDVFVERTTSALDLSARSMPVEKQVETEKESSKE